MLTFGYDAKLRNVELMGEAATHIPVEVRASAPDIPWREIVGARNRLAHGYLRVSDSVWWTQYAIRRHVARLVGKP